MDGGISQRGRGLRTSLMSRIFRWPSWAAFAARVSWSLPFILCFFPEKITEESPNAAVSRVVHVLIDDSDSMKVRKSGRERQKFVSNFLDNSTNVCSDLGCQVKTTLLSEITSEQGFSLLEEGLRGWWITVGNDPWILVSDGGDSSQASTEFLRNARSGAGRGLLVGFEPSDQRNLYFESVSIPPYAFEGRPAEIGLQIARADGMNRDGRLPKEKTQVQIRSGDQVLGALDISFAGGDVLAGGRMVLPALPRGEQPLQLMILPSPDEVMTWDNYFSADVEVLPNTLGLLHLLGTPSWDGRFFRRMVKAEPKFDLISFFILRDPWDNLDVSDRELSLIPFPAERLFKEELNSFRVLVLQDFTLARFLQPDYQENLVKFVKGGGGLMFIGGARALQEIDMASSPLSDILPFVNGAERMVEYPRLQRRQGGFLGSDQSVSNDPFGFTSQGPDRLGAGYRPDQKFKIEFANPSRQQRDLASVYDEWRSELPDLTKIKSLVGMHELPGSLIDQKRTTPLLVAKTEDGVESPLAVASFPGKGRALWLFSDSFWRLAMAESSGVARETYDRFMLSGLKWLMRQDLRKPLVLNRFVIKYSLPVGSTPLPGAEHEMRPDNTQSDAAVQWSATISGPATEHIDFQKSLPGDVVADNAVPSDGAVDFWTLTVCGQVLSRDSITINRIGSDQLMLSGALSVAQIPGMKKLSSRRDWQFESNSRPYCQMQLEATSKAFGSVKATSRSFVKLPLPDKVVLDSIAWLQAIQSMETNRTDLILVGSEAPYQTMRQASVAIGRWLAEHASLNAKEVSENAAITEAARPARDDPYWPFRRWWSWALLAMMPVEVLLRKVVRLY